MANGVFTIEADIVPVLDERQLAQQAAQISRQFSAVLAKQAPTIPINTDTKSFQKSIFDTTKLMEVLNSNVTSVKSAIATTVEAGRVGFIKFSDAVNLTNTKFIAYTGSIRDAISNNTKFKVALDAIGNSASAIKDLPDNFKDLSAQIRSGTSDLQIAAQKGSLFARSLVPFQNISESIRSELAQVNTSIQQAAVSITSMAQASGAGQKGLTLFATKGDELKAVFDDIAGKTVPQFGQQLINTFSKEVVKGPQALIDTLEQVRKEFPKVSDGIGGIVNVSNTIRSALFDVDRQSLSLTDQMAERFSRLGAKIKNSGIANVLRKEFSDDVLKTGFFDTFNLRMDDVQRRGVTGFKQIGAAINETFTNTKIGQDLAGARDAVIQFGKVIGQAVGDGVKVANNELQKLAASFQTGGFTGAAKTAAADVSKAFSGLFRTPGEGGAASIGLLTAPLVALGNVAKGLVSVVKLPFEAIGGAARLAIAPLSILKNVVGSALGEAGGAELLTGGIEAAIVGIGIAALQTAAKFETYKVAFDGLFGQGAGEKVLNLALEFDKLTHFSLETTIQSIEQLAGAIQNIQPEGALAILKQIGGAAAAVGASGDQVQRVVLAITQMSAAGRVTAQDLNQITQALPDISRVRVYDQIAKDLGVTNAKAKELAGQGLVDSETGLKAVIKVAHDVPGATTAMAKQAQTFNGLMTVVQTQLKKVLVEIGGAILPTAKLVLDGLIVAFEKLGPVLNTVGHFITQFFGALTHLPIIGGAVSRVVDGMNEALKGTQTAGVAAADGLDQALNALDPLKNAAAAVQALIPGVNTDLQNLASQAAKAAAAMNLSGAAGPKIDPATIEAQAGGLATLNLALTDLANTPDMTALNAGIKTFQNYMNSLNLPPDIVAKFNEFFDQAKTKVDNANTSFGNLLKKVLSAQSAFDAQTAAQKALTNATQSYDDLIANHKLQHDADQVRLTKSLADAQFRQKEAAVALTDAQTALNAALAPANTEDLEKADLSLASARLRLRQITEDQKKAEDALHKTQSAGVDLTGLSVDQIKSRLSLARAALTSQKAANQATSSGAKSAEQASIDAAQAAIDKRNAEIAVTDALATQNVLKAKGLETDPAVIAARRAVASASKADEDARTTARDAQTALNDLDKADIPFLRQKQAALDAIDTANKSVAKAGSEYRIAIFEAHNDQVGINHELEQQIKNVPGLTGLLKDSATQVSDRVQFERDFGIKVDENIGKVRTLNDLQATGAAAEAAAAAATKAKEDAKSPFERLTEPRPGETRGSVIEEISKEFAKEFKAHAGIGDELKNTLVTLLTNANVANGGPQETPGGNSPAEQAGIFLNNILRSVPSDSLRAGKSGVFDAIVEALRPIIGPTKDEKDFQSKVVAAFSKIGIAVHFAQGGIVNNATRALIGEAGKEAILPLTRPARLQELLSNKEVLHPVLSALGRITLPSSNAVPSSSSIPNLAPRMSGTGNSDGLNRLEAAKRDTSLAKAIVAEMVAAGLNGQGATIHNDFTAPNANDPLSSIHIRQIAREVKNQIKKELG